MRLTEKNKMSIVGRGPNLFGTGYRSIAYEAVAKMVVGPLSNPILLGLA